MESAGTEAGQSRAHARFADPDPRAARELTADFCELMERAWNLLIDLIKPLINPPFRRDPLASFPNACHFLAQPLNDHVLARA